MAGRPGRSDRRLEDKRQVDGNRRDGKIRRENTEPALALNSGVETPVTNYFRRDRQKTVLVFLDSMMRTR